MGTPHRGSSKAKLAELVANAAKVAFWQHPNSKLVKALTQDSESLERNRRSFASISKDLPIGSFFEGKGFLTMGLVSGLLITRTLLNQYLDRGRILCIHGYVQ